MGIGIFCYTRLFIRLKSVGLSPSEALFIRLLIRIFMTGAMKILALAENKQYSE